MEGRGERVHPTVENVERLVTNHPTGLRHPKMGPVLRIRGIDEPEVVLALAGELDEAPLGKLFAMGDPSVLINQMLRYPGNRAFATGLIHYLAPEVGGDTRDGGGARTPFGARQRLQRDGRLRRWSRRSGR